MRNTAARDRHRAAIAKGQPPCAICGETIDYLLKYPDPMSFVVDHIVPMAKGGADVMANKQPAHRLCNSRKSGNLQAPIIRRSGSLRR